MRPLLLALFALALQAQNTNIAIYNGASYTLRFPLAPGSFSKISGVFEGATTATAGTLPLPRELGGLRVTVNDLPAPLYAVRADEITFQVPRNAALGRGQLRVFRGSTEIATGAVDLLESAPGIFYDLSSRDAQGGVLNQAGSYAVPGNPAVRGQVIQIFGTGEGPLNGTVEDGSIPSSLATTRNATRCFVSVDSAVVQFSGASPQFPGLWQINVIVPDRPYIRGRVPLFCTVNGISTNVVTFQVAD
jgi:uncharacterized protein (TIGR03437 family)